MNRTKYCVMHAESMNAPTTIIAASFGTEVEAKRWIETHKAPWGIYRIRYPF